MERNTKASGKIIKCTARAPSNGLMAESMSVSITKIKNMVSAESNGRTAKFTKVIGEKGSRTERVKSEVPMG